MIEHPEVLFAGGKSFTNIEVPVAAPAKVVVVFDGKSDVLPAQDKELLFKILAAAKVAESEVAIVHSGEVKPSVTSIKKQYGAANILVFASLGNALGANMQLPAYELLQFGGVQVLRSAPLAKLATNPEHKAALWKSMKVMFGV